MAAGSPAADSGNSPEDSGEVRSEAQQQWESSCYSSLIDSLSALCTLKRKDAIGSSDSEDDHETQGQKRAMARGRGRKWMSGRLGRLKKIPKQVRVAVMQQISRKMTRIATGCVR